MMTPRFSVSPRHAAPGLALLIALSHGTIAAAQGHTANPYRPYNSVYDPYVFPMYPSGRWLFPQSRPPRRPVGPVAGQPVPGLPRRNRLGADPSGLIEVGGAGTPYYRAHRRFDPSNGPNNSDADRLFREKQEERDARYFEARKKYQEAVNERNPQKRARAHQGIRRRETARRAGLPRAPEPEQPGRTTIGPRGPPIRRRLDARGMPDLARPRRPRPGRPRGRLPPRRCGSGLVRPPPDPARPGARRILRRSAHPPRKSSKRASLWIAWTRCRRHPPRPRLQPAPAPR